MVEIGCVELLNHVPSGRTFHRYLNPERPMSAGALAVHGLTDAFLADKPVFAAVAAELHAFFGEARLVAHNAAFDFGFLNAEFARTGHPPLALARMVDTLGIARRKHPNAAASLDALCQRYGIDNTRRTKHGALLDAELLAEVYLELLGGKQADLGLTVGVSLPAFAAMAGGIVVPAAPRVPRPVRPLADRELAAHLAFVGGLGTSPVWRDYLGEEEAAA